MRLGYLYSRYPVLSQTFCDMEMLELERRGFDLVVGSIHPPLTSIRHPHTRQLKAPVHDAPPSAIVRLWEEKTREESRWPEALVDAHERKYGAIVKAPTRARNASYFAELFRRERVDHFHVHFANRAAHTALFLKAMSGIPFSVTAHGQDFMADLGNDELLCEICDAAEFVAVETEYSRGLMQARCPNAAKKIHRVYNGMDLANFVGAGRKAATNAAVEILSVGLLVAAGESGLFADALETLCRHPDLRVRYGAGGRARVEQHFQVETTVQPLIDLLPKRTTSTPPVMQPEARIAYLIDQWPDDNLPALETELSEVAKRTSDTRAFVCEFRGEPRLSSEQQRLALHLEFLPDAMALEAEWQANRELVLALEDDRANESHRAPVDLFLRHARFAVTLRRMFAQRKICHVHATSSRALVCGLLLKTILGVSLSAAIEAKPPSRARRS